MKEYLLHKKADIGPCMDVRGCNGRVYAIQNKNGGRLCVLSEGLVLLCVYDGIGNARQIEIKDGIAYITAREDGLWIFDLKNEKPELLSHYRTIEFATGMTLYKNFAFVSCRQYGVEIIDVSTPQSPRYIGVVRIGEAQSACVYNDVLYGGVWGQMKAVAVDISDITAPKKIAEYPLSGRGDGVVVKDGILYASTGQHKRGVVNTEDENDPNFGIGYGVEVFDVTDPANAKKLSWTQFEKSFSLHFDMWKPMICGDTLVCNSSVLGVYGLNKMTMEKLFHISMPNGEAATGTCVLDGKLYVTTGNGDLYLFDELEFEDAYRHDAQENVCAPSPEFCCETAQDIKIEHIYHGDFPVLAISEIGDYLALACGEGGVHVIDRLGKRAVSLSFGDFCYDVKASGEYIYAAFGENGIRVLRLCGSALEKISEFGVDGNVQQLALSEHGDYLALTCGGHDVKMVDVTDRHAPKIIYGYNSNMGLLYGENFLTHSYKGKGISLFWHGQGLVYSDPEGGDREFHNIYYHMKNGFAAFCPANGCDMDGENILFARNGGYVLLDKAGEYADDLTAYKPEQTIRGKFCVSDNILIATERAEGVITLTDISDIEHPKSLAQITTNATPSKAVATKDGIYIPVRFGGLMKITLHM